MNNTLLIFFNRDATPTEMETMIFDATSEAAE